MAIVLLDEVIVCFTICIKLQLLLKLFAIAISKHILIHTFNEIVIEYSNEGRFGQSLRTLGTRQFIKFHKIAFIKIFIGNSL